MLFAEDVFNFSILPHLFQNIIKLGNKLGNTTFLQETKFFGRKLTWSNIGAIKKGPFFRYHYRMLGHPEPPRQLREATVTVKGPTSIIVAAKNTTPLEVLYFTMVGDMYKCIPIL